MYYMQILHASLFACILTYLFIQHKQNKIDLIGREAYLILIPITMLFIGCLPANLWNERRDNYENRCKLTLRALGSVQIAFSDQHNYMKFGTWEELTHPNGNWIQQGYTKENLIDGYVIEIFEVVPATVREDGKSKADAQFLIVAVPILKDSGLRPYAIDQRITPHVWIGTDEQWEDGKRNLDDINLWQPVR